LWLIVVVLSSTAVAGAEGALFEPGVVAPVTGVRFACCLRLPLVVAAAAKPSASGDRHGRRPAGGALMAAAGGPVPPNGATEGVGQDSAVKNVTNGRVRRVAAWAAGFAVVFALLAAWSLATPKYAAPDEPAHAYRAASLVRGQLLGRPVKPPGDPRVVVEVPATLTAVGPGCFAFKSEVPASCMLGWTGRPGSRLVATYTGRYPPLYYLVVGVPSLLTTGGSMLLWMRLAGDVVNALFLTVGFAMLRRLRSPWAMAAGAVAVTPMVLFIGAVINPSGLEICSAFTLWCSLLAVLRAPTVGIKSSLIWVAVAAAVMESTRGLSPVLMAVTLAAVAAVASRAQLLELGRRRQVRVAGVALLAVGVLAAAWTLAAGALRLAPVSPIPATVSSSRILQAVLVKDSRVGQLVGVFGWLDTPVPQWIVTLWVVATVALLGGAALYRAWPTLAVAFTLLLMCFAVLVAGDILQARTLGLVSQGRYVLPLALGVPLLAGAAIGWRGRRAQIVAHLVMGGVVIGQIRSFTDALQRYSTGLPPQLPLRHGTWSPPLGGSVLTAMLIAALIAALVAPQLASRASLRRPHHEV